MFGMFTVWARLNVIVAWRSTITLGSVLSRHLLGRGISPKVSSPPPAQRLLFFPAVKTTSFDFSTVNLISYTKNVIQHHQIYNNWLKIDYDKKFIYCDPQKLLTTLYCQERSSWVLKIVETFGRSGLRPNPVSWGSGCCYSPNPTRSWPSPSIFGPSGLIRQSPQQSSFPPCLGVWIKHCTGVLISTLYCRKIHLDPRGGRLPITWHIVVSGHSVPSAPRSEYLSTPMCYFVDGLDPIEK